MHTDRTEIGRFLLAVLFLAAVFVSSINPIRESDSFYHLKTGQVIWETRSIPHADIYSYPAAGNPWVPHEWLAELIFFAVHSLGGFWGLILFPAALAALTYWLIFRMALRRGGEPWLSALLVFLLGYLTFELWIPRPQIFSFFFLVLLVYFLERYRAEGGRRYLAYSAGLMLLWANLHASFLLGLVILGGYFGAAVLNRLFPRLSASWRISGHLRPEWLGGTFLTGLALTLLNPSGYKIFLYGFYIRPAVEMLHVTEWNSILVYFSDLRSRFFISELAVGDILLLWWLGFRRVSRDIILLVLLLGFSVLPFLAIRHVGYWPLLAAPLIAAMCSALLTRPRSGWPLWFIPGVVSLSFLVILSARVIAFPHAPIDSKAVPVRAADFVEQNHIPGPVFNLYNEGGYLIWRFGPGTKISMDGRSEVYPTGTIAEYFRVATGLPGWQEFVNRHGVNYFFISYRVNENVRKLLEALTRADWRLIYWDDLITIYARNSPENAAVIRSYAYYHVSPIREASLIPLPETKAAGAEINRLLDASPDSQILLDYARRFLDSRTAPRATSSRP